MGLTSLGGLLGTRPDAFEQSRGIAGGFDGNRILVPLLTAEGPALTDQLEVATTLARAAGASLSVASGGTVHHVDADAPVNGVLDRIADSTAPLDGDVHHTHTVATGVLQTVRAHDVDTLVLPGGSRGRRFRAGVAARIAAHAACDVVVVNGRPGYEKVPSILLPVAAGPHSGLAADLARTVADDCDAWIDVLHVVDEAASERRRDAAAELVDDVARRIDRPETATWVLEADDVAEAIIEQSLYYGLTIIGAPTRGRLRRFIFGSTNHSVRANAGSVVLSVRNNSYGSSTVSSDPGA